MQLNIYFSPPRHQDTKGLIKKTLVFIVLTLVTLAHEGFSAPKLKIEPSRSVDFGRFISSQQQSTTFTLNNEGDEPLKIIRVRKTCGCAVIKTTTKIIHPNSSSDITIQIIPNSLKGKFSKKVFVETNDPKQRFTVLTLNGESTPRVAITPKGRIYAERLIVGKTTPFTYTLHKSDKQISLKKPTVRCNYPAEVTIKALSNLKSVVTLSVTPQSQKEKLAATITVPTDTNPKNDIQLHLSADVGPAIYAIPSRIKVPRNTTQFETKINILFAGIDLKKVDISKLEVTPIDGIEVIKGVLKDKTTELQIKFSKEFIDRPKTTKQMISVSYPGAESTRCRIQSK